MLAPLVTGAGWHGERGGTCLPLWKCRILALLVAQVNNCCYWFRESESITTRREPKWSRTTNGIHVE